MPFIQLLSTLMTLYIWVLIVGVVLSWLLMFNVVNGHNQFVRNVYAFCAALTDPALKKIRQIIRPINGIDLSPIVLILGVEFLRSCLMWYVAPYVARMGL